MQREVDLICVAVACCAYIWFLVSAARYSRRSGLLIRLCDVHGDSVIVNPTHIVYFRRVIYEDGPCTIILLSGSLHCVRVVETPSTIINALRELGFNVCRWAKQLS